MNILKKIIFPFFNKERHEFLFKKWWFRLSIVLYVIIVVVIMVMSFNDNFSYVKTCQNTAFQLYEPFTDELENKLAQCEKMAYEALLPSAGYAVLVALIFHYVVQLIFFKIIVDYVAIGNKK